MLKLFSFYLKLIFSFILLCPAWNKSMSKFFTVYEFWNVISTIWCIAEKNKIYRIIKSRCMIPPLSVGMMLRKARLHKLGFKGFAELFVLCNILLCGLLDVALKFTDFFARFKKRLEKIYCIIGSY